MPTNVVDAKFRREGRAHDFSIDIFTEKKQCFQFDVPAMNVNDAYYQLTKRIAYRNIPDIAAVVIYCGVLSDRLPSMQPIRVFYSDELVFVPEA